MIDQPTGREPVVHGAFRAVVVLVALVIGLSAFYVSPRLRDEPVLTGVAGGADGFSELSNPDDEAQGPGGGRRVIGKGGGKSQDGPRAADGSDPRDGSVERDGGGTTPGSEIPANLSCDGNNGGETDVGVDQGTIRLASTEVRSGIGSSFLGSARYGLLAVVQRVNREGGICGRQIELVLKDDGWDPNRGKLFIDNFIESHDYLALPVVPSSNGLDAAAKSGSIENADNPKADSKGIPVIGSDGMLNSQYTNPWIWPVAASTATTMRIMARDSVERAQEAVNRKPVMGIVYDRNYPFGPEGAGAFVKQAERDGASVPSSCRVPLTAGSPSYNAQIKDFNDSCGAGTSNQVDFVALLLEPETALTWLQGKPFLGTTSDGKGLGFAGPQPLFDKNFVDNCGLPCSGMRVWTSFLPPIPPYDRQPAVQDFKRDLCLVDGHCEEDALNAFTEGAYVGMTLVVEALRKVSPYVTRERLRQALDSTTLETGLTGSPLQWAKGDHYSNESMIAFTDTFAGGAGTFQFISGSQHTDPCPGCQDPPLSA